MTLEPELTDIQAQALAEFLKRVQFDDFKRRAVDEDEAYLMQDAAIKLKRAFEEKGYAPR